ncbi:MAG TPA: hypothetical protein VNT23_02970 [Gaiellaceae bacterium]|nr:hypothetical protein [Gaiellaceae bacterium]
MDDTGPYTEGDEAVGRELREFFLTLLEGSNLREYLADREGYIHRHAEGGRDETKRLLLEGTLGEIEQHVQRVTGSGNATPLMIVFPPL